MTTLININNVFRINKIEIYELSNVSLIISDDKLVWSVRTSYDRKIFLNNVGAWGDVISGIIELGVD